MKINRIVLNNFGIYYGRNEFSFNTDDNKKIILISGKNGSGKTTLLNAIKLSIYGPSFLGYQVYNEKYYSFVRSKLNAFALNEGTTDFYVSIDFTWAENGEENEYTIKRSWFINQKNKIEEKLHIAKNSKILCPEEAYFFINSIHSFMPSTLYNMFFFDGEKIEKMFFLKSGKNEVVNMFNVLFNLDIFYILEKDINRYIKQKNIYSTLDENEKIFLELSDRKIDLDKRIKEKRQLIDSLNSELQQNIESLKQAEKEFKLLGGLKDKQLSQSTKMITDLEHEKEKQHNIIKEIVYEYLPFLIIKDKLHDLNKDLNRERKIKQHLLIGEYLKSNELKATVIKNSNIDENSVESVLESIVNYFSKDADSKLLYNLSKQEEKFIEDLTHTICQIEPTTIKSAYDNINRLNKKISEIKKQIELNTQQQFLDKLNEIKELNVRIAVTQDTLTNEIAELESLLQDKHAVEKEIEKITLRIKEAKKDGNIFNVANKIINVINKFTKEVKNKKILSLESYMIDIFSKLIRKDDFIKEITINPDTLDISLINKLGIEMPESNLSAGEKQIYILSFLWAMLKVSNRKVPLVFDTLLGRLDESHKENIVTKFLPTCGEQVIILSTDSEVNDKYHKLLSPFISNHYSINFDSHTNRVIIQDHNVGDKNELQA